MRPAVEPTGPKSRLRPERLASSTRHAGATIQAPLNADLRGQKETQTSSATAAVRAAVQARHVQRVDANIGFYTSIAGPRQNPDDVQHQRCTSRSTRSTRVTPATRRRTSGARAENLSDQHRSAARNRWAVSQAAPFRRMHVNGGLDLSPAGYGWARGGYIADTRVDGKVESGVAAAVVHPRQHLGSWSGSNWNMVFSGRERRPGDELPEPAVHRHRPHDARRAGEAVPRTSTAPATYRVFLPCAAHQRVRRQLGGRHRPAGHRPIASTSSSSPRPGDTAATINAALAGGCNLVFTPGVYNLDQTDQREPGRHGRPRHRLRHARPGQRRQRDRGRRRRRREDRQGHALRRRHHQLAHPARGRPGRVIGRATPPTRPRCRTCSSASAARVRRQGHQQPASSTATTRSSTTPGCGAPTTATRHLGWTVNTADTGLIVNGNNVLATGLFVEHYQKYEVIWNGQGGRTSSSRTRCPTTRRTRPRG